MLKATSKNIKRQYRLQVSKFVGHLHGGSSSVSLFILVLLFEKNKDTVDIFQTNGMQIFLKAAHERMHMGKSEDLHILAVHAVKRCTTDQIETGSHCTQFQLSSFTQFAGKIWAEIPE